MSANPFTCCVSPYLPSLHLQGISDIAGCAGHLNHALVSLREKPEVDDGLSRMSSINSSFPE